MRRNRNTKILATLGPASSDEAMISQLFEAGVDVFRFNFSHGTHAEHKKRLQIIRKLEKKFSRPIGILQDLQGPKLRVGKFTSKWVDLKQGDDFKLDLNEDPGDETRAHLPHPEIFAALEPDMDLLLDDGKIRLRVVSRGVDYAETHVMTAGRLSANKGVNVPSAILDLDPVTEKDHRDLKFGLDMGVDWVGLSFVQRPEDVAVARKLIEGRAPVLVKLEKPSIVRDLWEIVDLADAIMVARGDLGVEVPPEDVPPLQKRIVRTCRYSGKPVVVATQMLDSMVNAPIPTRAEASDVATAVYDGADAVMLSAESAAGSYPLESVQMMDRIITSAEKDPLYRRIITAEHYSPEATAEDAITSAAAQVAKTVSAAAIVTFTTSGSTAYRCARERPEVPILSLTPEILTARRLAITWGVHAVETPDVENFESMVETAIKIAVDEGIAKSGERIVVTAGVPFGTPGATNILRIAWVN
ncbi:MAG: pyruvate kinase [Rhodospirillales bacterium]|jgi:pyruvate kinase